jgi:hypothetical protein
MCEEEDGSEQKENLEGWQHCYIMINREIADEIVGKK